MSKIVVIGGSGLIGSKVIERLTASGHDARSASPRTGVNTLTGVGLTEIMSGAATVIDVSNSPSFADDDVLAFFTTATTNITSAAKRAGVNHIVALTVVGSGRMTDSGYQRAKVAQEQLIQGSGVPYSLVHATQFFEFVDSIAGAATVEDKVRLPHVLIQPIAADDVAAAVTQAAENKPINGSVEVAGPEQFRLDDLARISLGFREDPRTVVTDPESRYFGHKLSERTLLPGANAVIFDTRFEQWLKTTVSPSL